MPLRQCKGCLLREVDEELYFDKLHDYMERIDPELKAAQSLYDDRLKICTDCDLLSSGLCRACGCFVELRAYLTRNTCPYSKW